MSTRTRVFIASLMGSSVEWFDFFLYGSLVPLVFNKLFFPNLDPTVAMLIAYASFGVPFFFRPLGGILFSHIGDKVGRKKTLIITLSLMGGATFLMGLLPSYQTIGIAAPILLVLLRICQGIALGGEWGGSMLLSVEYATKGKRGLFGSVPQIGVYLGMLMGTVSLSLLSLLPSAQFIAWGWRIPFLLSMVLVILGLWIRSGIDETPEFKSAKEEGNLAAFPLGDLLRNHWREVLLAIGAKFIESSPFYVVAVFSISYATKFLGYTQINVFNAVTMATIVTGLAIPLAGILSDKIGRMRLYAVCGLVTMAFAFPYFMLLSSKSLVALYIATMIGMLTSSPMTAIQGTLYSEIFDTKIRFTGISIAQSLGAAISGGMAPLVATALLAAYNNSWVPIAIYIVVMGVISLTSLYFIHKVTTKARQSKSYFKMDAQ
ncbi:MAG: MFS transporter [Anaerolineaceae bacterium]|nr:MFS transporter [Anaerolineaceae bacterium]